MTTTVYEGRTRFAAAPPAVYAAGRHCLNPDCARLLSIYNPGPCCYAHDGWKPPRPKAQPRKPLKHDWTPAEPARVRLWELIDAGWPLWKIAMKSGVADKTVRDIRDGVY